MPNIRQFKRCLTSSPDIMFLLCVHYKPSPKIKNLKIENSYNTVTKLFSQEIK